LQPTLFPCPPSPHPPHCRPQQLVREREKEGVQKEEEEEKQQKECLLRV